MSSVLLNSTENSATVAVINESTKADVSYSPKEPLPEMYSGVPLKVQEYSKPASLESQYISYQLPKEGCLQTSVIDLRFSITSGANGADDKIFTDPSWSGLDLLDRVEVRTSSVTLQTFHGEAIRARVKGMPLNKKISILKNAALRVAATDALVDSATYNVPASATTTGFAVQIPFFCFMTENSNFLDSLRCYLPKLEQLYVYVYFRPIAQMRFTTLALISSLPLVSAYLYMNRLTLTQKTTNELVAKNSSGSADVSRNMLMSYDYQRFVKALDSTTTTTFTHTITQAVRRTWIMLEPVIGEGLTSLCGINTFTLDLNGTKIVDNEKRRNINFGSEIEENSLLTVRPNSAAATALSLVVDDVGPICINWSKFPEIYDMFSGVASFAQIPNVIVTVAHESVTTAANYRLVIVHETFNTININEQGYLSVSNLS